jgi:hypothetical protein
MNDISHSLVYYFTLYLFCGIFVKIDGTNYDSQVAAFEKVWQTYGQVDFGMLT